MPAFPACAPLPPARAVPVHACVHARVRPSLPASACERPGALLLPNTASNTYRVYEERCRALNGRLRESVGQQRRFKDQPLFAVTLL